MITQRSTSGSFLNSGMKFRKNLCSAFNVKVQRPSAPTNLNFEL
jgi:hypothetical protein